MYFFTGKSSECFKTKQKVKTKMPFNSTFFLCILETCLSWKCKLLRESYKNGNCTKFKKNSPQERLLWWILTSLEFCKCMPSVFMLFPGEDMLILYTATDWQLSNFRWHCGLFCIVIPVTVTL